VNSISNRMRGSMAPSGFATSGEIRISTTAALTPATGQTLEPTPIAICQGAPNGTLQQSGQMSLFDLNDAGDHPLILNSGDTLAIRAVSGSGTGTWYMAVQIEWMEAVNF
jgi:hypothetical protein